jgi:hypothetical protein
MVKERNFKCPICPRRSYSPRGVAIHIAMKGDETHAAWRALNWLPSGYSDIADAKALVPRIMEILSSQDK